MKSSFVANHQALLNLYLEATTETGGEDIDSRLAELRESVRSMQCPDLLIVFERYLKLIALRLHNPELAEQLTLLGDPYFEELLLRDPSQPFALLGVAMTQIRRGDAARGRHLLRRLAASRYPERKQAQCLLGALVPERSSP